MKGGRERERGQICLRLRKRAEIWISLLWAQRACHDDKSEKRKAGGGREEGREGGREGMYLLDDGLVGDESRGGHLPAGPLTRGC